MESYLGGSWYKFAICQHISLATFNPLLYQLYVTRCSRARYTRANSQADRRNTGCGERKCGRALENPSDAHVVAVEN